MNALLVSRTFHSFCIIGPDSFDSFVCTPFFALFLKIEEDELSSLGVYSNGHFDHNDGQFIRYQVNFIIVLLVVQQTELVIELLPFVFIKGIFVK